MLGYYCRPLTREVATVRLTEGEKEKSHIKAQAILSLSLAMLDSSLVRGSH